MLKPDDPVVPNIAVAAVIAPPNVMAAADQMSPHAVAPKTVDGYLEMCVYHLLEAIHSGFLVNLGMGIVHAQAEAHFLIKHTGSYKIYDRPMEDS